MSDDPIYPDEPSGPFERPPVEFSDRDGREITIEVFDGSDEQREALVAMYLDFDPADRAQGIPPGRENRIREWIDSITSEDCHNVVAWDGDDAIGHATLVPGDDDYELAIFVLQSHQRAGIGTRLLRTLLGYGASHGADRVWLTVERWNRAAVSLYKKIGFETSDAESFELEMGIRLRAADATR